MPPSKTVLKKVLREYDNYEQTSGKSVKDLQEPVINACYTASEDKRKFLTCLDVTSKKVRKKLKELRKTTFADKLDEPVDDEIVNELIDELNTIRLKGVNKGLGDLKRNVILACKDISKTVDDLLTCIDEGEKLSLLLNKDLSKKI